jgi:hypothetical protein
LFVSKSVGTTIKHVASIDIIRRDRDFGIAMARIRDGCIINRYGSGGYIQANFS